ncbi:MAG: MFS transporter [Firmicutes bacterium]|nr:MFS transporter [Bacillota bacterium]
MGGTHETLTHGMDGGARQQAKPPLWTRNFVLISLANLLVFLGFQMLMPTLPLYVAKLGGQASAIGIVVGVFTISAVAMRPLVGVGLDRWGRMGFLFLGLGVFILSVLSYNLAGAIPVLLGLRLVHGFGWGAYTTSSGTIAADVIPAARRGEGMGYYGLSGNLAMAVAPVLGLFIANRYGFGSLFWTSATLAFLAIFLAAGIRLQAANNTAITVGAAIPGGAGGQAPRGKTAFFERSALLPSLVVLLVTITYGGVVTFVTLFAAQRGIRNVGAFFTVFAVVLMATRPFAGVLADKRGFRTVLIPGLLMVGAGMLTLGLAGNLAGLFLAAALYGIGFGAVQPTLQALTVQLAPPARRGVANATFFSAFDLGISLGSIFLGLVAQWIGYGGMYAVSALFALLGLAMFSWLEKAEKS